MARGGFGDHDAPVAVRDDDGQLVAALQLAAHGSDVIVKPRPAHPRWQPRFAAARQGWRFRGHALGLEHRGGAMPPPRSVLHAGTVDDHDPHIDLLVRLAIAQPTVDVASVR